MTEVNLRVLAEVGGALAHPGRLRILALLRDGPAFVCQLRSVLRMAPSTISAHLGILRRSGLVTEDKQGRFVQYTITQEEPLGGVVGELLYLVKEDEKILEDSRVLSRVRQITPVELCRAGVNVSITDAHFDNLAKKTNTGHQCPQPTSSSNKPRSSRPSPTSRA